MLSAPTRATPPLRRRGRRACSPPPWRNRPRFSPISTDFWPPRSASSPAFCSPPSCGGIEPGFKEQAAISWQSGHEDRGSNDVRSSLAETPDRDRFGVAAHGEGSERESIADGVPRRLTHGVGDDELRAHLLVEALEARGQV